MSDYTGTTSTDDQPRKPMVNSTYRNPVANAAEKLEKLGAESWMNAWNVILVAVVFAILIALVHYYTVASLFNQGEIFNNIGWVSTGGGILFFFVIALMIGSAGAAFGMSWKKNSDAAMWSIAVILVLGLLTYFMFASARDQRKDQFILWAGVSILSVVGVAGYGYWSMRGLSTYAKANPREFDDTDKKAIPERYTYSMATLGLTIVSAIAVAVGAVSMYRAISNAQ